MLDENFDSLSARPQSAPKQSPDTDQFARVLDFTPDELRMNGRGMMSERQRQKYVKRGKTGAIVILVISTVIVLDYLYLLFFYPSERLSESFQTLLVYGSIVFGALYATSIYASILLLRQHMNPRVDQVTGQLDIAPSGRLLTIGDKKFILDAEQAYELRRVNIAGGRYTLYYFTSLLGNKLLSVEISES